LFPPTLQASNGRGAGLRIVVRLRHGRAGGHQSKASGRGAGREGKENLTFENDKDRRRKADHPAQAQSDDAPRSRNKKRPANPEVGHALRAAYQQAVSEAVPPEMLDLLGKLG
jgi:hypothetical protein